MRSIIPAVLEYNVDISKLEQKCCKMKYMLGVAFFYWIVVIAMQTSLKVLIYKGIESIILVGFLTRDITIAAATQ